ncbi:hypothetical protein HYALB_00013594 [Hymenoscyphus albidus]|uniref:NADP-dependent oxidoreductase domain-containing protein n=1 Tax=Hymenoscyphus albidus TaxID=595503 RepID=A0A9N9PZH0_9HELO|nr:hypothetical protein HYALB_00013594 [Hymenoscyphus albidus]
MTSSPTVIFGAGGIGHPEKSFTFTWETPEAVSELLSTLQSLDIHELDSSAPYPPGNAWHTETLLGEAKAVEKGFIIDSKVLKYGPLTEENITSSVDRTLSLLGGSKIRLLYAHEPDATTPLEETAAALDKVGFDQEWVQQVARYFEICDQKGFVRPSVYQGHYNALIRGHEETLMPLLLHSAEVSSQEK